MATKQLRSLMSLAAVFFGLGTALAQDPVTVARQLAGDGLKAFDEGDYGVAADKLGAAYQVVRVPTLALYRARALEKLGQLVEAHELYQEATELHVLGEQEAVQRQAQREAAAARDRLLPRIPRVLVELEASDPQAVKVSIDKQPVANEELEKPYLVNAGEHVVSGSFKGEQLRHSVTLKEGDTKTVTLRFELKKQLPLEPSKRGEVHDDGMRRTLGWVGIGVGGAGLAVGGVTLAMLLSKKSDLEGGDCLDGVCGPSEHDEVDSYNSLRPISTAAFVVGVLAAGGGAYLLWGADTDQGAADEPQLSAWAGPGSLHLRGTF